VLGWWWLLRVIRDAGFGDQKLASWQIRKRFTELEMVDKLAEVGEGGFQGMIEICEQFRPNISKPKVN
jgi:hypothetical protein